MLGDKKDQSLGFERKNRFEICKKTAKIFEELKKRKINLSFQNRDQHSAVLRNSNGDFEIRQGMLVKNGISPKTRLERCLGHIAFDTPNQSFSKNVKPTLLTKIPEEYNRQAGRVLEQIFDAFEDRRTESNYGMLYKGALERFREARQIDAKAKWEDKTPIPVDPVTALQMASLDQYEAVRGSEFSDAIEWMKLVEHTGKRGALMLTKKFWNEVGEKWFLDYIDQIKEQEEEEDGDGGGESDENQQGSKSSGQQSQNGQVGGEQESDETDEQEEEDEQEEGESGDGKPTENPSKSKKSSKDMKGDLNKAISDMEYQSNSDHQQFEEDEEITEDDIGTSLEAELNAGEEEIDEMEEAIANMKPEVEKAKYDYNKDFKQHIGDTTRDSNAYYKVDQVVARRLSKAFRKIKGNDTMELDTYGMEIDVDAYIDRKIKGYGDFLTTEKNITGFDIVIGVDESGSMSGHKIQIVRNMVATLYKSLEMTPQVKLKVVGWQSGSSACEIHEVNSLSEVSAIDAYGGTPLALGTWHCKHLIEKMGGLRKVFFQITDGDPNDWNDVKKTVEAVRLMRKKGIMCFGIFIGHEGGNGSNNMKEIFGKESALTCNTVEDVSKFLTKELTRKVLRHLARAC